MGEGRGKEQSGLQGRNGDKNGEGMRRLLIEGEKERLTCGVRMSTGREKSEQEFSDF